MRCRNARSVMQNKLAGTATTQQLALLHGHLAECPHCSRLCDELPETAELVSQLRNTNVSAEFDERFAHRLKAAQVSLPHAEHGLFKAQKRISAAMKHYEWSWVFMTVILVILFAGLQTQIPEEIKDPSSVSSTNLLAMLAIGMIVSIIVRSTLESDFRLFGIFRRLMQ